MPKGPGEAIARPVVGEMPDEKGRVRQSLHHQAEEAQLGCAKGRPSQAQHGGEYDLLYPGRGT